MSSLIVEVCKIESIFPHPDETTKNLEVCRIKGWESVIRKGMYNVGDLVVYLPPDSMCATSLSDLVGATKYLAELPKTHELRDKYRRVKAARIRGYPSYGLILGWSDIKKLNPNPFDNISSIDRREGCDVADVLNILKWEPPVKVEQGDAEKPNPLFHQYTDIEHIRNYPEVLQDGEEVVILEKIHGSNCRVGSIYVADNFHELVCGSHRVQRKVDNDYNGQYAAPLKNDNLRSLIGNLIDKDTKSVIVFGEIYGAQGGMRYGKTSQNLGFAVFDIAINGNYMNWDDVEAVCKLWDIPTVPVLYRGPFSLAKVNEHTTGPIMITDASKLTDFNQREGIVVKPTTERMSFRGRVIFKSVSADYLDKSAKIEDTH